MNQNAHGDRGDGQVDKAGDGKAENVLGFKVIVEEEDGENGNERVIENEVTDDQVDGFGSVSELLDSFVSVVAENVGESEENAQSRGEQSVASVGGNTLWVVRNIGQERETHVDTTTDHKNDVIEVR